MAEHQEQREAARPTEPVLPGQARVWLELGEGTNPIAALEAVLADCKAQQAEVQGYWYDYWQMANRDGTVTTWWIGTYGDGSVHHDEITLPYHPPYYGVDRRGRVIQWRP